MIRLNTGFSNYSDDDFHHLGVTRGEKRQQHRDFRGLEGAASGDFGGGQGRCKHFVRVRAMASGQNAGAWSDLASMMVI